MNTLFTNIQSKMVLPVAISMIAAAFIVSGCGSSDSANATSSSSVSSAYSSEDSVTSDSTNSNSSSSSSSSTSSNSNNETSSNNSSSVIPSNQAKAFVVNVAGIYTNITDAKVTCGGLAPVEVENQYNFDAGPDKGFSCDASVSAGLSKVNSRSFYMPTLIGSSEDIITVDDQKVLYINAFKTLKLRNPNFDLETKYPNAWAVNNGNFDFNVNDKSSAIKKEHASAMFELYKLDFPIIFANAFFPTDLTLYSEEAIADKLTEHGFSYVSSLECAPLVDCSITSSSSSDSSSSSSDSSSSSSDSSSSSSSTSVVHNTPTGGGVLPPL